MTPARVKVVPELAKSWDVLDEGKTYVFHLVEASNFMTARRLMSSQVEFDRILDPAVSSGCARITRTSRRLRWSIPIRCASAPNIRRETCRLPWPGIFRAFLWPHRNLFRATWQGLGAESQRHWPFKLKEWIPGKHVILEKNPDYFKRASHTWTRWKSAL